ncbi:tRNA preQ1(34) S-adenosylmethionine ribosyltransferase-isomerase QueA [Candidatus Falkowbacteria bacterium]|nr:tRNA preQ1(34) S-adenosylmethionine ribosyltransferase-isomerase QueA [Candidatus Falkowbacteria bacterium]
MALSDFDYELPKELIAQEPHRPRDRSRLFVLRRQTQEFEHRIFSDIADYLDAGDVLVLNNTKVFPARLNGKKRRTGGAAEVFLLRQLADGRWLCLVGGKGCAPGLEIVFAAGLSCIIREDNQDGTWVAEFNLTGAGFDKAIKRIGQVPLPPYIKRPEEARADRQSYQTVFADDRKQGSVAAPTAGLHFTDRLLEKIKTKGLKIEYVTLHVGLGTFAPVKSEDISKHKMHAEWYEVEPEAVDRINEAKRQGRKVIAVGTTAARTLETAWSNPGQLSGWTDIFIFPGYSFKVVDGLITNFHTPKSTLLMLISAFVENGLPQGSSGLELVRAAYQEAIAQKYRFFSYGDAMFIV